MLLDFKRTLVSIACVGLLAACGGEEDEAVDRYVVYSMTAPESGVQTFQQQDLVYDNVNVDSDFVYRDQASDETTEIVFNTVYTGDRSLTDTEELEVIAITDLNENYSALSIDNVPVESGDNTYRGDYIVIQDKSSGELYPVLDHEYVPLSNKEITELAFWHSAYEYANMADQKRVYINESDEQELYVFELQDGAFVWVDTYDYADYSFWVNEEGDILSQKDSNKSRLRLLDRSTGLDATGQLSSSNYEPFLYDGEFYAVYDESIYDLTASISGSTLSFDFESDDTWAGSVSYSPTSTAARLGDYEMTASCELYLFDTSSYQKEIVLVDDFDAANGQLAVAGQNALFCVHAESNNSGTSPIITKFDLDTEDSSSFTTTAGTIADVQERFVVLTDEVVMFSEEESSSFHEYYINLSDEDEQTELVSESSVVGLQRL